MTADSGGGADVLWNSRHHVGGSVGNPACLVVNDRARASCPRDGVYWLTVADGGCRFGFGACVEHTALVRAASDHERAFTVVSVTSDNPYRPDSAPGGAA